MSSIRSTAIWRPFVVAPYVDDRLLDVPLACFCASPEVPCDVVVHTLRARKTGPVHELAVCKCLSHDVAFTVYPPGFLPYARRSLLADAAEPDAPSVEDVAREAANSVAWNRSATGGSDRWWSTQGRVLERAAKATGLRGSVDVRDAIAVTTGLSLSVLAEGAKAVGYCALGAAILAVFKALGPAPLDHLLLAGALAGCWGAPWRWDAAPARLRCLVPADLRSSPIRSTTSGHRAPPPDW